MERSSEPVGLAGISARLTELWNSRAFDEFYASYADDLVYHAPDGATCRGPAALRERYDMALAFCPDLKVETLMSLADETTGRIASLQRESGTDVNGNAFGFEGMIFGVVNDDGRLVEVWEQIRPL